LSPSQYKSFNPWRGEPFPVLRSSVSLEDIFRVQVLGCRQLPSSGRTRGHAKEGLLTCSNGAALLTSTCLPAWLSYHLTVCRGLCSQFYTEKGSESLSSKGQPGRPALESPGPCAHDFLHQIQAKAPGSQ
jgi:hypothetical protein